MDLEIPSLSRRSAQWLERSREALLDELAHQLSLMVSVQQPDRQKLRSAVTIGAAEEWPPEVLGFWIAALRLTGASWDDIGDLLSTSRQAAHRRFAPWERRYRPFLITYAVPAAPPHMPRNPSEVRAYLAESFEIDKDNVELLRRAINAHARDTLHLLSEPPPE